MHKDEVQNETLDAICLLLAAHGGVVAGDWNYEAVMWAQKIVFERGKHACKNFYQKTGTGKE